MQLESSVTLFDDNKVESKFAELQITADGITSQVSRKVGNDEVISRINQSAEAVTIDAGKVNIRGVINAINSDGTTTIDGGKITTNSISANKIKVAELINIGPNSGAHANITSDGLDVYGADGGTAVASFGSTARVGKPASANEGNVYIDNNSVDICKGGTVLSTFTADGAELGKNSDTAVIGLCNGVGSIQGKVFESGSKGVVMQSKNESAFNTESDGRSIRMTADIINTRYNSYRQGEAMFIADVQPNENGTNNAKATIYVGNDIYNSNERRAAYTFGRYNYRIYDEASLQDRMSFSLTNGNMWIAGAYTQESDRRLKDHRAYLGEDADKFIRQLKPAYYIKDEAPHLGFYAQDVAEADKWNCMTGEMNGYMTLGYTELISPLVAYCQHLEERIEELERRNDMDDLIKREDVIDALNECEDIRGFAYRQMHDAIMEIPSVSESEESNE